MKPIILFVTEIKPYPTYGGIYLHIYNVLSSLSQHFRVVVLAPSVDEDCPLLNQIVDWFELPAYDIDWWARASNGRYLLLPRPTWTTCLRKILQEHRPQVVWFNYGHWGQYVSLIHQFGAVAIMQTQNIQSELTQQRASTMQFGLSSIFMWLRWRAEAAHEHYHFRHFDRIISVTEFDRRYHARFVGDTRSLMLPNYINRARYINEESKSEHLAPTRAENILIMTGHFESFQNIQGIRWFMEQVWVLLHQQLPDICLYLLGNGAKTLPAEWFADGTVQAIDEVPSVAPYLWHATVAIVPILHGSGMRIKIIEAIACKLPVISTTLGAQGINIMHGESIMLADTPSDFAQSIVTLLKDKAKRIQIARNGIGILERYYTTEVVTEQIRQLIQELV